jgi:succinoglycan biosynthesis transport protein ExoP
VEISALLTMLRRWSLTLVASAVMAGAVGFIVASITPKTYTAEAQVLVGPINTDRNTLLASQELVQTYGSLVTSDRIIRSVIDTLDLSLTPTELRGEIEARPQSVTRILFITASADDASTAAAIANEIAGALREATSGALTRPEGEITVVTAAEADPETAQPFVPLVVVIAAAAGLVAGLAMVLLIDYFGDTISSREDLNRLAQAPVLASITPGRFLRRRSGPLIVEASPRSNAELSYRLMASHVVGGGADASIRSVLVLGADGQEAAGEVAANLAAVLVHAGQRVRLVDANDEAREVTHLFNINASLGLGELARGDSSLVDLLAVRVPPGIDVFPSLPGRNPRLSDHDRIKRIVELLESDVDAVILTSGPVHRSETALLWAREVDAAILVARRDRTKRDSVTISVETLRVVGTRLLGAVLHGAWRRPAPIDIGEGEQALVMGPSDPRQTGEALPGRTGRP